MESKNQIKRKPLKDTFYHTNDTDKHTQNQRTGNTNRRLQCKTRNHKGRDENTRRIPKWKTPKKNDEKHKHGSGQPKK